MKKKVIGIGEIVLDKVHVLATFPPEGEKILAQEVSFSVGGPVPVGLILLARLGVECSLVASVADDEAGLLIKNILKREGVHLLAQKVSKTPLHTVLVNAETGSRTIIKDMPSANALRPLSRELVRSVDGILCDRHEPSSVLNALKDKKTSTPVLLDPSVDCSTQTIALLKNIELPIVPIETVFTLFPQESMEQGSQKLSILLQKTIVVTMGKFGSAVCSRNSFRIHPPVSVKVVDTLGAGDVFRGAFLYGMLKNWDIDRCVDFANAIAALQCTKLGNSTAIPTQSEIVAFQKNVVPLSVLNLIQ